MKRKFIAFVLIFVFVFSSAAFASTGSLSDKKDKLNNVNENIKNIKGKIKDVNNKQNDIMAEINKISAEVDKVQKEINSIDDKVAKANTSIAKQEKQLEDAIEDYENHRDLYYDRVKVMYMDGPASYIDILLSSKNFSDFLSRTEVVTSIIQYDKNILSEMKDKQELITEKKEKLLNEKENLVSLQKQQVSKKAELANANEKKRSYYAKLESDEGQLKKELELEEKESNALEGQIKSILTQKSRKPEGSSKGNSSGSSSHYSGSKTGILRVSDIGYVPSITSTFGRRYHPILHEWKTHTGIDIGVPSGTPVYSMSDGEVIIAQTMSGYGNVVVVDHGGGISTLYAHNSKLIVGVGQHVEKGQQISVSGMTGYATGPHLHFEVRKNGVPINPMPYFVVGK